MALALLPILVDTHAAGIPEEAIAWTWRRSIRPALDALDLSQHLRAAVHLSGPTLGWAAQHDPAALQVLSALCEQQRVEMLVSGAEGPLLATLPERDAVAQVRRHLRQLHQHLGVKATTCWLAAEAWDPQLSVILHKAGVLATFVDEGLVALGRDRPDPVDGWYRTHTAGSPLAILPLSRILGAAAPFTAVDRVLAHLEREASAARTLLSFALPFSRLGDDPAHDFTAWWPALADALKTSRVRTILPGRALRDLSPKGSAWPPAGTPPVLRAALFAPWADAPPAWSTLADASAPAGPSIDALLAAEPVSARLVARTRRVSDQLVMARRDARKVRRDVAAVDAATAALQRAQSGACLHAVADMGGNLLDPAVRHAAWSAVDSALNAIPLTVPLAHEVLDLDGDGHDELEVRTRHLLAVVAPSRGGAITELIVPGMGNFANVCARRPSPERARISAALPLPVLVESNDPDETYSVVDLDDDAPTDPGLDAFPASPPVPDLIAGERESIRPDDLHPRLIFQERLLGAATTLHSLRAAQHPEEGDFLSGSYRLERAEPDDNGVLEAVLVREGTVGSAPGPLGMIQVHKRLRFAHDSATINVSYEVVNRSREPVHSTFAVELNLNLDGLCGPLRTLHLPGQPPLPFDAAGEHLDVADFALRFGDLGTLLRLRPSRPARIFHFPIHRPQRVPVGYTSRLQCVSVVFAWPLALWGQERWQSGLSLQFHRSERAS